MPKIATNTTFESATFMMLAREAVARCKHKGWNADAITAVILSYVSLEAFVNELAQLAATLVEQDERQALRQALMRGQRPTSMSAAEANRILREEFDIHRPTEPSVITQLASALPRAIAARATTEYRYALIMTLLAGKAPDRSREPRQALTCLAALRNHLVHIKAEETSIELEPPDPSEVLNPNETNLGRIVERYEIPSFASYLVSHGVLTKDPTARRSAKVAKGNMSTSHERFTNRICTQSVADWACKTVVTLVKNIGTAAPASSALRARLYERSILGSSVSLDE